MSSMVISASFLKRLPDVVTCIPFYNLHTESVHQVRDVKDAKIGPGALYYRSYYVL